MSCQKRRDENICRGQETIQPTFLKKLDAEGLRGHDRTLHLPITTYLLPFVLLTLVLLGLFAACAGQQPTQDPAGTATQDPPIPQITQATHGIVDTTGTVPQSLLAQLRSRSDDVQAHGYQIAVVFFNNLASDPHQFATTVFNANGIGFKDTNNGVLFVLYLQKAGKDGHAPWLAYITGGGISGSLPDTLMDDYAQTTFVPARAEGQWQNGLLAFYDKVSAAERDPSVAREWQTKHPQLPTGANPPGNTTSPDPVAIIIAVSTALVLWLAISAVVAARRRENFFWTAFRLLGRFLLLLAYFSRGMGSGSSSGKGGSGAWGGGGSSPSSGGDV